MAGFCERSYDVAVARVALSSIDESVMSGQSLCTLLLSLVWLLSAQPTSAQQHSTFQSLLSPLQVVVSSDLLQQPLDYVALSDGSVIGAEYKSAVITRLAADGRVLWRVGREGSGPGEFRVPYRLAVAPDQTVLVYDLVLSRFTRVDSSGVILGSTVPDMRLSVNSVLVLASGDVLIAGTTTDPRGRDRPLHLFSKALEHKRSFGEPGVVSDARYRSLVGPGTIAPLQDGGVLHMRESPYEMVRYSPTLQPVGRTKVPIAIDPPELWSALATGAGGRGGMRSNPDARRPLAITQLDDNLFLGGVSSKETSYVLFDRQGTRLDEIARPREWQSLATFDYARRTLWIYGERDDEPVMYRMLLRR